jgi:hypothetical protein
MEDSFMQTLKQSLNQINNKRIQGGMKPLIELKNPLNAFSKSVLIKLIKMLKMSDLVKGYSTMNKGILSENIIRYVSIKHLNNKNKKTQSIKITLKPKFQKMIGGKIPFVEVQKAKQKELQRQEQMMNDPKNDEYYERLERQDELNKEDPTRLSNKWMMDRTPEQQRRAMRIQKLHQQDFKESEDNRIQDEYAERQRIYEEEQRRKNHSGFWNTITSVGTNLLSAIPVIGEPLSQATGMLADTLRGEGKRKRRVHYV